MERDAAIGFPNYCRPVIVDFYEGGKPEYPEKNPWSQIEIDKSQLMCGFLKSIPGRRGGKHK